MDSSRMIKSTDIYSNIYDVAVGQLTWRPAAYAIIVDNNKILLVKERGLFHMPGGGVNLGETPEQAVVREVREETGLTVANPQLAGSLSTFFTNAHKSSLKEPAHVQSLLLYYRCDLIGGELSSDGREEDEKEYDLLPEWILTEDLETIVLGSTVDWRGIVKATLEG
jgi:8-oxo-dGTP diphosphatase